MALANVNLTDTFQTWMIRTNQIISSLDQTNTYLYGVSTSAFDKANSANVLAYNTGIGANAYAVSVGNAGNTYAGAVGVAANSYSTTVGSAGNTYTIRVGAASNTWANAVGVAANSFATSVGSASNSYATSIGFSSNAYAFGIGQAANSASIFRDAAGNNYTNTVGAAANNWANTIAASEAWSATTTITAWAQAIFYTKTDGNSAFAQANAAWTRAGDVNTYSSITYAPMVNPSFQGTMNINGTMNASNISVTSLPSGSRVLLLTLSAAASASLSNTSIFTDSRFSTFEIEFVNILPSVSGALFYMKVITGGATVQTGNYGSSGMIPSNYWAYGSAGGGAPSGSYISAGLLSWISSATNNSAIYGGINGSIKVNSPSNSSIYKCFYGMTHVATGYWNGVIAPIPVSFSWNGGTSAVTGFQAYFSSGNITSGTIKVYGIK